MRILLEAAHDRLREARREVAAHRGERVGMLVHHHGEQAAERVGLERRLACDEAIEHDAK